VGNLLKRNKSQAFQALATALVAVLISAQPQQAAAASAQELEIKVDAALEQFRAKIKGADTFLASAKGVLVFPSVFKAGFVLGGEYGEGALRVNGATVDYYNTAGASFGFQIGAQTKTIVVAFMQQQALDSFRSSMGWEAGVDGSVALIEIGVGGSLDSNNIRDPIIGFVFGNKGLMYNLTLEGSKFTKLNKGPVPGNSGSATVKPDTDKETTPDTDSDANSEEGATTFPLD
jgi:lipid-binding SYLF domain-containing protein